MKTFTSRGSRPVLNVSLLAALLAAPINAEDDRVTALRARIADLEGTLEREKDSGPLEPVVPPRPEPISTAGAAEAAEKAKLGTTDREYILRLAALSMERRAPELYAELEKNLLEGPPGWVRLYDLLDHLDDDKRSSIRFYANYTNAFALVHLAMLHEVELARFFHFYLVASVSDPKSDLRKAFYGFAPVFLRFHAGRFPQLEGAFHLDILARVERGDAAPEPVFAAMKDLRFFPDPPVIWPYMEKASSLLEWNLVFDHLRARDDHDATGLILRFIAMKGDFRLPEVRLALSTLAALSVPRAEKALEDFMTAAHSSGPATRAYFSVPRAPHAAPVALAFLNSNVPLAEKRSMLGELRTASPDLLRAVGGRIAQVRDAQVADFVRAEIARLGAE